MVPAVAVIAARARKLSHQPNNDGNVVTLSISGTSNPIDVSTPATLAITTASPLAGQVNVAYATTTLVAMGRDFALHLDGM